MGNSRPADDPDYRNSHLQRGTTYDANLAGEPFDAFMNEMERFHLQRIVPALFPAGVPRYLDFACGTARITATVGPHAQEAVGVDISPSMLEEARKKCPQARFLQADLTQGTGDLGQFDLATSFRFFGNAQQALRRQVLQVLARLVRPGGYLIVNNHRNPQSLAALFHRATGGTLDMDLTHSRFRSLLAECGFQLVDSKPIGVWLYRSSLTGTVGKVDERILAREKFWCRSFLTPIAPDTILIAQRAA